MSGLVTSGVDDAWSGAYWLLSPGDWVEWDFTLTQFQADILNAKIDNPYGVTDLIPAVYGGGRGWWGWRKYATSNPIAFLLTINGLDALRDDISHVYSWGVPPSGPGRFYGDWDGQTFNGQVQRAINPEHFAGSFVYPGYVADPEGEELFHAGTNTFRMTNRTSAYYGTIAEFPFEIDFCWINLHQDMHAGAILDYDRYIDPSYPGLGVEATPGWFPGHVNGQPHVTSDPDAPVWLFKATNVARSGSSPTPAILQNHTLTQLSEFEYTWELQFEAPISGTISWYTTSIGGAPDYIGTQVWHTQAISGTTTTLSNVVGVDGSPQPYQNFFYVNFWFGGDDNYHYMEFQTHFGELGFLVLDPDLSNPVFHKLDLEGGGHSILEPGGFEGMMMKSDGESLYIQKFVDNGSRTLRFPYPGLTRANAATYKYAVTGGAALAQYPFQSEETSWCFDVDKAHVYFPEMEYSDLNVASPTERIMYGPIAGPYSVAIAPVDRPVDTWFITDIAVDSNGDLYILYDFDGPSVFDQAAVVDRYVNNVRANSTTLSNTSEGNRISPIMMVVTNGRVWVNAILNGLAAGPGNQGNRSFNHIWSFDGATGVGADESVWTLGPYPPEVFADSPNGESFNSPPYSPFNPNDMLPGNVRGPVVPAVAKPAKVVELKQSTVSAGKVSA